METTNETKRRANSVYTFAVQDGKQVFDFGAIGKIVFDPAKVSAENRARAMMHGFKQRIVDGGALDAGANGKVDPAEKFNEMFRIAEHLMSGSAEWNVKGGGAGAASYVTRALVRLATYQGNDVSTYALANAFVKDLAENPKFEKLGFKGQVGKARTWLETKSATIAQAIKAIRDEEAASTPEVDADAMLEEMANS